jgi:hypothetical protein
VNRDKNVQKEKYKKLLENHKKQLALEIVNTGTGACPKALQQRTTSGTTNLHQPPPDTTGCGPHVLVAGENSLAHAGHAPSRRDHHGRGLTQLDQKKPTTTTEERVSIENQWKTTYLAPKISPNFARLDKTFAEDTPRTTTPLNQLLE